MMAQRFLSTTNWTGNLVTWASETVGAGMVSVTDATTLDIVINTANDSEASNNTIQKVIGLAPLSSLDITVNVFPTSMQLKLLGLLKTQLEQR